MKPFTEGESRELNRNRNSALIERINHYLYETGIPKTKFCQRLDISTTYLYKLINDERPFSDRITAVFDEYLSKQGY